MKPVLFHAEAERELWNTIDYYETKCTGLGLDFEKELRYAISKIQMPPKSYPPKKYGARCRLLHRFPYSIYYLELQDIIWIISVAHSRRRPYYWLKRLY